MLYYQTVDAGTLELLKKILSIDLFSELRLVGGTSLALQIGHRKSIDLDFFGNIDVDVLEINRVLAPLGAITLLKDSKNIHVYLVNGIKVDIVNYTYPWLKELLATDGLRLATYHDIAAMKLAAITGRGSKKDFIDLYFLLKEMSLATMLQQYLHKYNDGSLFLVIKSLIYFEDAELEQMPDMLYPVNWQTVKDTIITAYTDYLKSVQS